MDSKRPLFGIAAVAFFVQMTRFSLWQRHEYWLDEILSTPTAPPLS